jgi:hypothetical protein
LEEQVATLDRLVDQVLKRLPRETEAELADGGKPERDA